MKFGKVSKASILLFFVVFFTTYSQESAPSLQQQVQETKELAYAEFPKALQAVMDSLKDEVKKEVIKELHNLAAQTSGDVRFYKGNTVLYGATVNAVMREDAKGFSYTIQLPKNWSMAETFPTLKSLDGLTFLNAAFVFSDHEFEMTEEDASFLSGFKEGALIEKGFNFIGDVKVTGALKNLSPLVKVETLLLRGVFTRDGFGTLFSAKVPGELSFAKGSMVGKELELEITIPADKPLFMLNGTFNFMMPHMKKPLLFSVTVDLGQEEGRVDGTLKGDWQEPFGLKGVTFKKVTFNAINKGGLLSALNFTGDITVKNSTGTFGITTIGDRTDDEYAYVITLPKNFDISRMPGLEVFKGLTVLDPKIIYSTYELEEDDLIAKPGLNFSGTVIFGGPLQFVKDLTKIEKVAVSGVINQDGGEQLFSAFITGDISFGKRMMAKNIQLTLKKLEGDEKTIYGLKHDLYLTVPSLQKPLLFSSELTAYDKTISLKGNLTTDWKDPLGIDGITLRAVLIEGTFNAKERRFSDTKLSGDVYASPKAGHFDMTIRGDINSDEYSIIVSLPKTVDLGKKLPGLKALGGLQITESELVYSSYEYEDEKTGASIKRGLNFAGNLQLTGALAPLKKLTTVQLVVIAGVVPRGGAAAEFRAAVPGIIKFGSYAQADNLKLALTFASSESEPSRMVECDLKVTMPHQKEPLKFSASFALEEGESTINATLHEHWKEPFGMKGATVQNATLDGLLDAETKSLKNMKIVGDLYTNSKIGTFGVEVKGDKTEGDYSYIIMLPPDFKIATALPGLKALSGLRILNTKLVYSSYDYDDEELEFEIKQGLNFGAEIQLEGPLAPVKNFTKAEKAMVSGLVADDPAESFFTAKLPGEFSLGSIAKARDFMLDIRMDEKSEKRRYALKNLLTIKVPAQDKPLEFDAQFIIDSEKASLEGKMKEDWKEPFGIPEVRFADVEVRGAYNYKEKKLDGVKFLGDVYASPKAGRVGIEVKGSLTSDKHSFVISLPDTLKLGKKLPGLTVLNGLTVKDPKLVYSTWSYEDTGLQLKIKPGLNFYGRLQLVGPLASLGSFSGLKETIIGGAVSKKAGAALSVGLPGTIKLGKVGTATNLSLELAKTKDDGLSIGMRSDLKIELAVQGMKIPFAIDAAFSFGKNQIGIAGKAKQDWKDPLLLKGVTIRNLLFKAVVDYKERKLKDINFDGEMVFGSQVMLANIEVKGEPPEEYSIVMHLPSELNIASAVPVLKLFNGFSIADPLLVYSTMEYGDEELKASIKPGVNFVGTVQFTGPLALVKKLTKAEKVTLSGVVPKQVVGATFSALVPGEISFGAMGKAEDLKLVLAFEATGLQTGIESTLELKLPGVDLPRMSGLLQLGATAGTLKGRINEPVKNFFGIKGLTVENLEFLKTTFSYTMPPVLTNVGFSGILKLGQANVEVTGAAGVGQPLTLVGRLGNLSLGKLLQQAGSITGKALNRDNVLKKVPDLTLKDAEVYIVQTPTTIGGRLYKKGFSVKASASILKKNANFLIHFDGPNVMGAADMDAVNTGILHITGAAGGSSRPNVHLELGPKNLAQLYVDGMMRIDKVLGGISSRTKIEFSPPDKMSCKMFARLSNAFLFDINVGASNAILGVPTNFYIDAEVRQSAIKVLQDELTKGVKKYLGDSKKVQDEAEENLAACQARIMAAPSYLRSLLGL